MAHYSHLSRNRADELPALLHGVHQARRRLVQERRTKTAFYPAAESARFDMLVALEAYADALAATGWPLPYRLRDELFLYRGLSDSMRSS